MGNGPAINNKALEDRIVDIPDDCVNEISNATVKVAKDRDKQEIKRHNDRL